MNINFRMELTPDLTSKSETIVAMQCCIIQLNSTSNHSLKIIKWLQSLQTEILNIRDMVDLKTQNYDHSVANYDIVHMTLEIAMMVNKTLINNNKLHTIKNMLELFIRCNNDGTFTHAERINTIDRVVTNMNDILEQYYVKCTGDAGIERINYHKISDDLIKWMRNFSNKTMYYAEYHIPYKQKEVHEKLKMFDNPDMRVIIDIVISSLTSIHRQVQVIASHIRICSELAESTRENAVLAHNDACSNVDNSLRDLSL